MVMYRDFFTNGSLNFIHSYKINTYKKILMKRAKEYWESNHEFDIDSHVEFSNEGKTNKELSK